MPQITRAIRPMFKSGRWRIFRDDTVWLRRGPEKGLTGKVLEVIHDTRVPQVLVEGRNLRKKKIYTGNSEEDFFVVTMEAPIHYSRVAVIDPVTKRPVRTGFRYLSDGTRVRIGKGNAASGQIIPIPDQKEQNPKLNLCGVKDTPRDEVQKVTYDPTAGFPFKLPRLSPIFSARVVSSLSASSSLATSSISGMGSMGFCSSSTPLSERPLRAFPQLLNGWAVARGMLGVRWGLLGNI